MILKNSEFKNFLSWRISTRLKSLLVASCHFPLPHIIRPMSRIFKIFPKIILQSSIAQSSPRSRWPWRRRVLSCFDTGLAIDDKDSGSISLQDLSPIGTVLVDDLAGVRLLGFALAFDRLVKASTFVFNAKFSCSLLSSPCCSSPWPTYSSHEKFWSTSENCLCLQIQFWFPLHIYLVSNKL